MAEAELAYNNPDAGRKRGARLPRPCHSGSILVLAGTGRAIANDADNVITSRGLMNAEIITIARCIARHKVEDQIRAEGRKLGEFALRDIKVLTQAYLAQHPEVFKSGGGHACKY